MVFTITGTNGEVLTFSDNVGGRGEVTDRYTLTVTDRRGNILVSTKGGREDLKRLAKAS